MAFSRYREVLRTPGVARLVALTLLARAPNGMSSLAILLLVSPRHGYGHAGVVVGAYVAVIGICGPLSTRLCARLGLRRVLIPMACGYCVAMAALAAVATGPYVELLGCAVAAGVMQPPIVAIVRGLWPRLFPPEQVQVLYGLEATAQELVFIIGPALVALIAAVAGARVAVVATGILGFAGTVGLVSSPLFTGAPSAAAGRGRVLSRRLLVLVGLGLTLTIGFNMVDVGVIAFMSGRRAGAASGIALSLWGAGSMLGGLLFGAAQQRADNVRVARSVIGVAAGVALLAVAPGRVGLVVILFAGGAAIAPAFARLYGLVAAEVSESGAAEAFAWLGVGFLAGSSVGSAAGGLTVDAFGARTTFLLAAALPTAFATAMLLAGRRDSSAARFAPTSCPTHAGS
jgi:predicted MFS family arabinose efflux permease